MNLKKIGSVNLMLSGTQFKQGEIWLVPFPHANFSSKSKRPVLILSNDDFNKKEKDVLVCQITTNIRNDDNSISLNSKDLKKGFIPKPSEIRCHKINILEKSRFIKRYSELSDTKFMQCSVKIRRLIHKPPTIQGSLQMPR